MLLCEICCGAAGKNIIAHWAVLLVLCNAVAHFSQAPAVLVIFSHYGDSCKHNHCNAHFFMSPAAPCFFFVPLRSAQNQCPLDIVRRVIAICASTIAATLIFSQAPAVLVIFSHYGDSCKHDRHNAHFFILMKLVRLVDTVSLFYYRMRNRSSVVFLFGATHS